MTPSCCTLPRAKTVCTAEFDAADAVCPAQLLVIDRPNGPASVLVDTVSLLAGREISVTLVTDAADALRALDFFAFDAVIVGVEAHQPVQLAVLPPVHALRPELPVLVVGRDLPPSFTRIARHSGAGEVIDLPRRAAELKGLTLRLLGELLPQRQDARLLA